MKMTRRALLVLGAALCFAGSALAQHAKPDAQVLRIVGPWEIAGLEPSVSGYLFSRFQVTETLTDADDAGRPLPGLAASWTVSPDQLSWRFVLRSGARFHDGSPVSAKHVASVLQRALGRPGVLDTAPISAIEAQANDVLIRLKSPFSALPALLAHTSTQILAPASFDAKGTVTSIIGSGPYRIVTLEPPQKFEVALFEGWEGKRPAVTRASYLSAGRAETRAVMAESGQADLVFAMDPASVQRLRRSPRVTIEAVTIPRTVLVKLNAGHRALAEPRARQALSLAIDRAGIAKALLRDPELAATQLFPPTLAEWHYAALPPLRADASAARRLLAELGWQPGVDGILVRNGERFQLTLRTFPDRPELPILATAIQEQWRKIGVELKVSIGNSSEIPAGHRDGSLDVALASRNFALIPDPIGTMLQDYGPQGGDWGAMNWHSAELERALDELARGSDGARRATLRAAVSRVLQDELPIIPVSWYRQTVAVSKRVEGVTIDPLERSYRLVNIGWRAGAAR